MTATKQYAMPLRTSAIGVSALAIILCLTTSAQAITFGEWATEMEFSPGRVMPASQLILFCSIDSLAGIENYNWTATPTVGVAFIGHQISRIESGRFSELSKLQSLLMNENQIECIEPGAFSGLNDLTYLDLCNNKITNLESGTFSGLDSLAELYLSRSQIVNIEPGAFSGLGNVVKLNLFGNQITSIESHTFSGLSKVTQLDLSGNQITSIKPEGFNGLDDLAHLEMRGNQITAIDSDDFEVLNNLTYLDLSGNPITSIKSGAFSKLHNLTTLCFVENASLIDLNLEEADFSNLVAFLVAMPGISPTGRMNDAAMHQNTPVRRVSLKNAILNQTSLDAIVTGGSDYWIGIGEISSVTELDLSGVDFAAITDYGSLRRMRYLTDLWLVGVENMDALKLDAMLDELDTMQNPDIEGTLYMTQANYDAFNLVGGGLLAAWNAEPGHHVQFVPEPAGLALLALGLLCCLGFRLRR